MIKTMVAHGIGYATVSSDYIRITEGWELV